MTGHPDLISRTAVITACSRHLSRAEALTAALPDPHRAAVLRALEAAPVALSAALGAGE